MAVTLKEWLDLIDKEYLRDFIVNGGAAVKFVSPTTLVLGSAERGLDRLAASTALSLPVSAAPTVKLHMIQDVFFAVSRQIAWEADAQRFVEGLFQRQGYQWPTPGEPVALTEIADANKVDATILRREFQ